MKAAVLPLNIYGTGKPVPLTKTRSMNFGGLVL